jgi:hypothetical protein
MLTHGILDCYESIEVALICLRWDPNSDLTPLMTENGITDMRVAYEILVMD